MSKPLVRIVDDDAAVLDGLTFLLEGEGWDVKAYGSAQDFLKDDSPSVPGCLILDINMPGMSGLELQQAMLERRYDLPIIFLTGHGSIDAATSAIRSGAVEFLEKTSGNERIVKAVRDAVGKSAEGFANLGVEPFEARRRVHALTERERLIAGFIAEGLLNRQIGERLGISVRTVEAHRLSLFHKLGVRTAPELSTLLALAGERS
ncbi:MAG: putative transcriptional regulatory protein FixJ [Burkholderia sp.]|jgi:FixJ family two-component response regulator